MLQLKWIGHNVQEQKKSLPHRLQVRGPELHLSQRSRDTSYVIAKITGSNIHNFKYSVVIFTLPLLVLFAFL